mmetsp:Transcript_20823/g.69494  ORF Transcript_20823/g.69494 Transcript_20823/m.69494 type:complete len:204 (+) Transcript_20823:88-699(+)
MQRLLVNTGRVDAVASMLEVVEHNGIALRRREFQVGSSKMSLPSLLSRLEVDDDSDQSVSSFLVILRRVRRGIKVVVVLRELLRLGVVEDLQVLSLLRGCLCQLRDLVLDPLDDIVLLEVQPGLLVGSRRALDEFVCAVGSDEGGGETLLQRERDQVVTFFLRQQVVHDEDARVNGNCLDPCRLLRHAPQVGHAPPLKGGRLG